MEECYKELLNILAELEMGNTVTIEPHSRWETDIAYALQKARKELLELKYSKSL